MNEDVQELLDCFDGIADAWIDFFAESVDIAIFAGCILMWLLVIFSSPIWVGPYLLWRKFHD